MIHRTTLTARHAALALLLAGCATLRTSSNDPAERSAADWRMTAARVSVEAEAGRYADVERLLAEFQRTHEGSAQAPDAAFARALYRLDPANGVATAAEARALVDSLLPVTTDTARRGDLALVRRVAVAFESRPAVVRVPVAGGTSATPTAPAKPEELKSKDDEIARLKEELGKANAELERVRRRLATPKP